MNNKTQSIESLTKLVDIHSINFLIISHESPIPNQISIKEAFIMEGVVLGLCVKGTARIKINFQEYNLRPDMILVLLPKQIVHFVDKSDDFLIESFYLSLDFLIGMPVPSDFPSLFNIRKYPCLEVTKPVMQNLLGYFSFIIKQYNRSEQFYRDTIIKGLLYSLIMEFLSIYKFNKTDEKYMPSNRQEELVNNFFKLLTQHFREERSVAFYADKLCITRKYLSSTVKDVTGHSVLEWIHEVFIIQAKLILKTSNKTIVEISEDMNIANPSFFCRLFKEHTGMSPLEYRNA